MLFFLKSPHGSGAKMCWGDSVGRVEFCPTPMNTVVAQSCVENFVECVEWKVNKNQSTQIKLLQKKPFFFHLSVVFFFGTGTYRKDQLIESWLWGARDHPLLQSLWHLASRSGFVDVWIVLGVVKQDRGFIQRLRFLLLPIDHSRKIPKVAATEHWSKFWTVTVDEFIDQLNFLKSLMNHLNWSIVDCWFMIFIQNPSILKSPCQILPVNIAVHRSQASTPAFSTMTGKGRCNCTLGRKDLQISPDQDLQMFFVA